MAGCYDGTSEVRELRHRGNFGLGTLHALDGEMVVLDGVFYHVKSDGSVSRLEDGAKSPFAVLTFFKKDRDVFFQHEINLEDLKRRLDKEIRSPNLFYAVRIEGDFKSLKVRSAAPQEKPYPVLSKAIESQKVFRLENKQGTLVGFRFPASMEGVNVSGYHFHFLSRDKTEGGHVLDLLGEKFHVKLQELRNFSMTLPPNEEFLQSNFTGNLEEAVAKVER